MFNSRRIHLDFTIKIGDKVTNNILAIPLRNI